MDGWKSENEEKKGKMDERKERRGLSGVRLSRSGGVRSGWTGRAGGGALPSLVL